VARKDKSKFNRAVNNYLQHRTNLCLVFALLDSGLPPQELDLAFVEWLTRNSVPFVLVFTKADKVSPPKVRANIEAFMGRIAAWFEKPPAVFTCSAKTQQGREELLGVIAEALAAIRAEAKLAPRNDAVPTESTSDPKAKARENRKRRPDLNRPW
jgi:GTP-binding protein